MRSIPPYDRKCRVNCVRSVSRKEWIVTYRLTAVHLQWTHAHKIRKGKRGINFGSSLALRCMYWSACVCGSMIALCRFGTSTWNLIKPDFFVAQLRGLLFRILNNPIKVSYFYTSLLAIRKLHSIHWRLIFSALIFIFFLYLFKKDTWAYENFRLLCIFLAQYKNVQILIYIMYLSLKNYLKIHVHT